NGGVEIKLTSGIDLHGAIGVVQRIALQQQCGDHLDDTVVTEGGEVGDRAVAGGCDGPTVICESALVDWGAIDVELAVCVDQDGAGVVESVVLQQQDSSSVYLDGA